MKKDAEKQRLLTNIILVTLLAVLSVIMISQTHKSARANANQQMNTMADERAIMITDYVSDAENILAMYSNAGEIRGVAENPDSSSARATAQEYTERFSSNIVNLEGIYVSTWETEVLAHTNAATRGMITRTGDSLKQLQDSMLAAGNGVYDTGIIISPASQKQIVSMYKAIYDSNNKPIGLVGLGIYTEGLVNSLDNLSKEGVENAVYSMVNAADYKYIFVDDSSKVAQETDNEKIRELCDKYKNNTVNDTGSFEYKKDGRKYLSTYSYIGDKGWILMIDNPSSEVFAFARTMTIYLTVFCLVSLGIIVLFNIISKKQEETSKKLVRSIEKHKKARENLSNVVMHDILTDTDTRVSFLTEYEKGSIADSPDNPYYFIMTNIRHFSDINIEYGNDAGDFVLVQTAEVLRKIFKDSRTYRTGSDEFITVEQSNSQELIMSEANKVLAELSKPKNSGGKTFSAEYGIVVVKKSKNINNSVILSLKSILNNNNEPVIFVDLDEM